MIYYTSLTGNVRRFIGKTGLHAEEIRPNLHAEKPFILVTYTIGFGEIPKKAAEFLRGNHALIQGVAVSGNRVWGANYGKAGDLVARQYDVPLLMKFELDGTPADVSKFKEKAEIICGTSN